MVKKKKGSSGGSSGGDGVSVLPEDQSAGGFDDIDATFSEVRVESYETDYGEKCGLLITLLNDEGEEISEYPQRWSVGPGEKFVPIRKGTWFGPADEDKPAKLNKNAPGAIFFNYLLDAGFPKSELRKQDVSVLDGLKVHMNKVDDLKVDKEVIPVLVVTEIYDEDGNSTKKGKGKAAGKLKKRAKDDDEDEEDTDTDSDEDSDQDEEEEEEQDEKPAKKKGGKVGKPGKKKAADEDEEEEEEEDSDEEEEEDEDSDDDDGDLKSEVSTAIGELYSDSEPGASMTRVDLGKAIGAALKKHKNVADAKRICYDNDFLNEVAEEHGLKFDGKNLTKPKKGKVKK